MTFDSQTLLILLVDLFLMVFIIGRRFYNLADFHFKNKWLYGCLGIGSYYAGQITLYFLCIILMQILVYSTPSTQDLISRIVAFGGGVVCCVGFYQILKRKWERDENTPQQSDDTILDNNLDSLSNNL